MSATHEARLALATIGLAWTEHLPRPARAVHDLLRLDADGLYRSTVPAMDASPDGLTLTEALGLTLAVAWAHEAEGTSIRYAYPMISAVDRAAGLWTIRLPGVQGCQARLATVDARALADALLAVRRIVWPSIPWRPRDMIAEHIERHIRLMDADLRGPAPIEVITPYTAAGDVGRAWR